MNKRRMTPEDAEALRVRIEQRMQERKLAKQKQDAALTDVIRLSERMGLYDLEDAQVPTKLHKPTSSLG